VPESKEAPLIPSKGKGLEHPMVRGTVDGMPVRYQSGLKNEYNPEGITLTDIDMKIVDACGPTDDTDYQLIDMFYWKKLIPIAHSSPAQFIMLTGFAQNMFRGENSDKHQPASQPLIENNDDYFKDLIKRNPRALLKSLGAQDAWARWSYAANWIKDQETNTKANKFLESCLSKKRGPRPKNKIDKKKLLTAYKVCFSYFDGLYNCAKALKSPDKAFEFFPDAVNLTDLKGFLIKIIIDSEISLTASDYAAKYIGRKCGLSGSHITNLLTKERGNPRKKKTKLA
jgi:hypothetical protein